MTFKLKTIKVISEVRTQKERRGTKQFFRILCVTSLKRQMPVTYAEGTSVCYENTSSSRDGTN